MNVVISRRTKDDEAIPISQNLKILNYHSCEKPGSNFTTKARESISGGRKQRLSQLLKIASSTHGSAVAAMVFLAMTVDIRYSSCQSYRANAFQWDCLRQQARGCHSITRMPLRERLHQHQITNTANLCVKSRQQLKYQDHSDTGYLILNLKQEKFFPHSYIIEKHGTQNTE